MQPDLFDIGSREAKDGKTNKPTCTPYRVGSGPDGETCKTCSHYTRRTNGSAKVYLKCGLMRGSM